MDRMDRERGGYYGRGPRGYTRSDERIREDVCDRLCDDPFVDASDMEVNVNNGEVTLTGTIESRDDKRRAEGIAETCLVSDSGWWTFRSQAAESATLTCRMRCAPYRVRLSSPPASTSSPTNRRRADDIAALYRGADH